MTPSTHSTRFFDIYKHSVYALAQEIADKYGLRIIRDGVIDRCGITFSFNPYHGGSARAEIRNFKYANGKYLVSEDGQPLDQYLTYVGTGAAPEYILTYEEYKRDQSIWRSISKISQGAGSTRFKPYEKPPGGEPLDLPYAQRELRMKVYRQQHKHLSRRGTLGIIPGVYEAPIEPIRYDTEDDIKVWDEVHKYIGGGLGINPRYHDEINFPEHREYHNRTGDWKRYFPHFTLDAQRIGVVSLIHDIAKTYKWTPVYIDSQQESCGAYCIIGFPESKLQLRIRTHVVNENDTSKKPLFGGDERSYTVMVSWFDDPKGYLFDPERPTVAIKYGEHRYHTGIEEQFLLTPEHREIDRMVYHKLEQQYAASSATTKSEYPGVIFRKDPYNYYKAKEKYETFSLLADAVTDHLPYSPLSIGFFDERKAPIPDSHYLRRFKDYEPIMVPWLYGR